MESNQFSLLQSPAPAKRDRTSDEENSPSLQQHKQQRMEGDQVEALVKKISEFEKYLTKLNKLDGIESDVQEIRKSQAETSARLEKIEERVVLLETEMETIKSQQTVGNADEVASEIQHIKSHTQQLAQSNLNNTLIIRNFPSEIQSDKKVMDLVVSNIFRTLELDVHENEYDATAIKVRNKDIAFIQLKLSSQLLKNKVLMKFRHMKKAAKDEPPFILDKLMKLSEKHELNGTMISMQNKLTKYMYELLQSARKHSPSHFDFVYDDPDGRILAKIGNRFHTISSHEDVAGLVKMVNVDKSHKQKPEATSSSDNNQALRRSSRKTTENKSQKH